MKSPAQKAISLANMRHVQADLARSCCARNPAFSSKFKLDVQIPPTVITRLVDESGRFLLNSNQKHKTPILVGQPTDARVVRNSGIQLQIQ